MKLEKESFTKKYFARKKEKKKKKRAPNGIADFI